LASANPDSPGSPRKYASVIGPSRCDERAAELAEEVGRLLAKAGFTVVTGGELGVMEAASRGACEAGGLAVGILPGNDRTRANRYCEVTVVSGMGHARNLSVVASADVVVAVGGEWGTLSEIAYARKLGRPVVALQSWPLRNRAGTDLGIVEAETAEQAVKAALSAAVVEESSVERTDAADDVLDQADVDRR
jgi:uncharacterized protein (TIGR00725 family)